MNVGVQYICAGSFASGEMADSVSRAGRPRDVGKGVAILDAAWSLFLARGVEATTIETIAAWAGVSKVTVYSHYPDKTALFVAAVRREMERIEDAGALAGSGDTTGAALQLTGFGIGLMTFLVSQPAVDFYSVVAGELRRHPDLAAAFYRLGPGHSRATLAAMIAAGVASGELEVDDPKDAAEALFGLWQGFTNYQLSLNIDVEAIRADIPGRVSRGVARFMRLYAAG